jgi:hypothetical protein
VRQVCEGWRPDVPATWPLELQHFISRCWAHDPQQRPTFEEICAELDKIRGALLEAAASQEVKGCCTIM